MIKGYCPDCGTLQPISPGAQQAPGSAFRSRWWLLDMHKDPTKPAVCDGSGKRI